jgi:ribosomal protein S6--L-glutamate ligase
MNIGILSRGPTLYSTQRLREAGESRGYTVHIIDHARCHLLLGSQGASVYYQGQLMDAIDGIIPRVGSSVTTVGASVVSHFELMGVPTTARAEALLRARNKMRSLQHVSNKGFPTPLTVMVGGKTPEAGALAEMVGGFPLVVKPLEGTHGVGVMLVTSYEKLISALEMFERFGQPVLIQEFIREAEGADIRAIVIDGEIAASMQRRAKPGEFRSNLHRGGTAETVELSWEDRQFIRDVAKAMELDVAGIDLLPSKRGLLVMEVNTSPGLEGIEQVSGEDVAGKFYELIERKISNKEGTLSPGRSGSYL